MSILHSLLAMVVFVAILKLYIWAQERYWQDLQQTEHKSRSEDRRDARNDAIRVNPPDDRS